MKITIVSRSGDFNALDTEIGDVYDHDLKNALAYLRGLGGYHANFRKEHVFVPFEQILYIKKGSE